MNYYNIEDLVIGESLDPQYPAYIAIDGYSVKATISEFTAFSRRVGNQVRRFARQSQVKESRHHGRS